MTLLSRTQKSKKSPTPSARPSSLSPKPYVKTSNTPPQSPLSPKPYAKTSDSPRPYAKTSSSPRQAARSPKSRARS